VNKKDDDKPKPKEQLKELIENYLGSSYTSSNRRGIQIETTNEVEMRFTKNKKPLTKLDYDNVIKNLYNAGFKIEDPDGFHSLRISYEYRDERSQRLKMSNIRAEINGIELIQKYCNNNSIQKLLDIPTIKHQNIIFTQKLPVKNKSGDGIISAVDFPDFGVRVDYKLEKKYFSSSERVKDIIRNWTEYKKTFRHLNRVRFYHDTLPVFADLSIIRNSRTTGNGKAPMKEYTIQEANVFNNPFEYQVEMEFDNSKVGIGTNYSTFESVEKVMQRLIRIVLGGLQGTSYPISYKEIELIQHSYIKLVHGPEYVIDYISNRNFIGPKPVTLQMENIMDIDEKSSIPNIRKNYTVTDKADGERVLLFVNMEGRIYLINQNMNIMFTGSKITNEKLFNSLLDGELITHDKNNNPMNLFAAFDIYFLRGVNVRKFSFYPPSEEMVEKVGGDQPNQEEQEKEMNGGAKKINYRYLLLDSFIKNMKLQSIVSNSDENTKHYTPCKFHVKLKTFYSSNNTDVTIFDGCRKIWSKIIDNIYEYNTDGLIFTPSNTGVGSSNNNEEGPLNSFTWKQAFKWKPAKFNTNDFLVTLKRDEKTKKVEIHNAFQNGNNLNKVNDFVQYKTLILRCGYSEKDHGYLNPFEDMINNKVRGTDNIDNENSYKPVPFIPTNPYDNNACFTNIILKKDKNNEYSMFTEEGEYFDENMIVEFRYDLLREPGWRWVPLRVRYDKTEELLSNKKSKQYGNAYHVANSNWQTIHRPITEEMITSGDGIPDFVEDADVDGGVETDYEKADEGVYYSNNGNENSSTKPLRDFHNLYVKNKLINGVSKRNDTLIDFAMGKGGDIPKWISSNLSFVFGIDISKPNIYNKIDGACARYLNYIKKNKTFPSAIFLSGNSGNNIRNGDAFTTEKDKVISKAIFGVGPKDKEIGEVVYNNYGIGEKGFQISSCQFALHYFFENINSIHRFLRNLSECTKINGYFIGTCYDGKTVFDLMKNKNINEPVIYSIGGKKIFELTKLYNQTGFSDDETSIGYPISVYQETIGKSFIEYLVNFNYFIRLMDDYGFALLQKKEEANPLGLPNSSGLFSELFREMENEIRNKPNEKKNYGLALNMTPEEKQISFLNRYFVFRKVRDVQTDKVAKIITQPNLENIEIPTTKEKEAPEASVQKTRTIIKKKQKVILKKKDNEVKLKVSQDNTEKPVEK